VELYGELLEIGGGKERMTKYFTVGVPSGSSQWEFPVGISKGGTGAGGGRALAEGARPRAQPRRGALPGARHAAAGPCGSPRRPRPWPPPKQDVADREPFKSTTDGGARSNLVKDLHKLKTDLFMELVEAGSMPLRPGVERLVKEAIAAGG
jgi:hypothetical protein